MARVGAVCIAGPLLLAACSPHTASTRATPDSTSTVSLSSQQEQPLRVDRMAPRGAVRAARLVDSTVWTFGDLSFHVYRVAVEHDSSVDTLPNLRVLYQPVLVGDSMLLGVAYDSAADDYSLFSYSAGTGQIASHSPPKDLRLSVSIPAFAPDGKELAYVAFPGDETGTGILARWPTGEVIAQTSRVAVPATDMITGWASWQDTAHFELDIGISDAAYVRFRGARGRGAFDADTVLYAKQPH